MSPHSGVCANCRSGFRTELNSKHTGGVRVGQSVLYLVSMRKKTFRNRVQKNPHSYIVKTADTNFTKSSGSCHWD
jgi:hypothetical protein